MTALPLVDHPLSGAPASLPLVTLRREEPRDVPARDALLDAAMAPGWRRKSSEAIRRGRRPAEGLSLVAADERDGLVGTVRLWHVAAGESAGHPVAALLLGPLAVRPGFEGFGIGAALMRQAVADAASAGHGAILLVGDEPYYGRFGFRADAAASLAMPGPFERHRLLALDLRPGFLAGAGGLIRATGRRAD